MTVICDRCEKRFPSDHHDPGESQAFDEHECTNLAPAMRKGESWEDYSARVVLHDSKRGDTE